MTNRGKIAIIELHTNRAKVRKALSEISIEVVYSDICNTAINPEIRKLPFVDMMLIALGGTNGWSLISDVLPKLRIV